jgi:hypothetical protein
MNGKKAKLARRKVYGDRDPADRQYQIASDKKGNVVGKFVTVDGKKRLWIPTVAADYMRRLYKHVKAGM